MNIGLSISHHVGLKGIDMTQQLEAMKLAQDFIERTSAYLPTTFDQEGLAIHASLRQAIEQAQKQDKFCDSNCVWTDHHPDCVRAQKQEPVGRIASTVKPVMRQEVMLYTDAPLEIGTAVYTSPPQRQPLTDEQEREAFEDYAVRTICNPVELQRKRLGGYSSQELNYLWRGWKARAAHGVKGEA
jgi:hypothetical protein